MTTRRAFLTGMGAMLTAPAIVRASSLDYVPRSELLAYIGRTMHVYDAPILLESARVLIRDCTVITHGRAQYGLIIAPGSKCLIQRTTFKNAGVFCGESGVGFGRAL